MPAMTRDHTTTITSDQLISEYNMNRNQCEPMKNPLWIERRQTGAENTCWYTHVKSTATAAVSDQDVMTNTLTCHYTLSIYRPEQASGFLIGSASVTDNQSMFEVKLTALILVDGLRCSSEDW
ncbi:hypothetical protein X801_02285 [Opisthorchis viverrini]|uniref:Uncharacterized protein n=1 Tax=Opisthorchis viverrini TaxID=6198 RepID=A0A1S8X511_OPIVI|nr:hypothetical protein X801_02285 [Opisthorchis viverrini]